MATKTTKRITRYLNSSALSPLLMFGTSFLLGTGTAHALDAGALPQNPNVVGGNATVTQSGNTLTVKQSSNRTVIDWRSFNIGSGATTNFVQPGSSSIAVNRVNASANPTQIQGSLNANGQVWILNPNGVIFGKTSQINVAGIVASTANINPAQFMAGSNSVILTGADHGSVVNQGSVSVGANGLAAFVAPSVRNSGTITAKVGKVTLAAGTSFTLDLAGDKLVEIDMGAGNAVVDQSGHIVNAGGTVTLSARAAGQVVDSVINMSGVTSTVSAHQSGGSIVLDGDNVSVSGTADASGTSGGNIAITGKNINVASSAVLRSDAGANGDGGTISSKASVQGNYAGTYSAQGGSASGNGGTIETSGNSVTIDPAIKISAAATNGTAGTWLLDPENLTIDGTLAGTIESTLAAGTSDDITTSTGSGGSGDITLTASINATSTLDAGLTLEGRHLSETGGSTINISGGALTLDVNSVNTSSSASGSWITDALNMVGTVSGGSTINLAAATYVEPSGTYINVNKSNVTIDGASEAGTIIDARSASTYGLRISGPNSNVTLENFTLYGSTGSGTAYGLKAENTTNLVLTNITSRGATKSEIDLNGILGGTLTNLTADGAPVSDATDSTTTAGNGIAFTDSQNITLTGSTTKNNAWGGLALYQTNSPSGYPYQETGIVVDGTNSFTEANGIYAQDQSATNDFGTINLTGQNIQYIGQDATGNSDGNYTFFQKTLTGAIAAAAGSETLSGATVQGYAGNSVAGNNTFYVDTSGTHTLSIDAAINAATSGATINVAAGTFAQTLDITKNVDIEGAGIGNTIIQPTALLDTGVGHKYTADMKTTVFVNGASAVTLNNMTIDGNDLGNDAVVFWNNASGSITNALIENAKTFDGTQTGQGLAVDVTTGNTDNLTVNNVTFQNWNKNGIDAETGDATANGNGTINLTVKGSSFTGAGATGTIAQNGIVLWEQNGGTVNATIDSSTFANLDYTDPASDTAAGVLQYGSPNGTVSVSNSSFTNVQEYISTAGGVGHELNATVGNTFDGVAEGTATLDQLYAIENQIIDGTDNPTNALVRLVAGQVYATAQKDNIQNALDVASSGDTVNIQDGTYVIAPGSNYINVTKSLTLDGESETGTIIDARNASTYGLRVSGPNNDVTLENFTLYGATGSNDYGLKVEDTQNLVLQNITSRGAAKSEFDLNGVRGGTLTNLTADGAPVSDATDSTTTAGNGISFTDSQNLTLTDSTTKNNAWGGLALYQTNSPSGYPYQETGIVVDGSNTFTEVNGIYAEDQSTTNTYGSIDLSGQGINFIVQNQAGPNDFYTFFQKTQQGAIDLAASVSPTTASVQGYAGTSVDGTNTFTVGVSTGGTALSINAAIDAASSGAVINILPGDYTEGVTNVDFFGAPGGGQNFGLLVDKDNITVQGVDASGNVITNPNDTLATITAGHEAGFGAQDFVSGNNDTIQGLTLLPVGTGTNKLLEVIGDNFTLKNSVLDTSNNGTESALYIDTQSGPGYPTVNSFTIQDNIFYGGNYSGVDGGGIVKVAAGAGLTTDVSTRIFDGNTIAVKPGEGLESQVGFQIQGLEAGVPWQAVEAGPVTITNDTFTNVAIPVRTVGRLTSDLDWGAIFNTNGNVFTGGAVMDTIGSTMTADAGTVATFGGTAPAKAIFASLSDAIAFNGLQVGDTVNLLAGTYTLANELDITKSIAVIGSGAGTVITSNSTGYGINVTGSAVTLENFTFNAPTAHTGTTYGIKVTPATNDPSDRFNNFDISNVTINGGWRTGLDLNGVDGAVINNVSVSNVQNGNGIALTDSANVTITNSTTTGNAWGGLALYQTNHFYNQQETNITVDATNTFNETNGIYTEDQSSGTSDPDSVVGGTGLDFGTLNIAGYNFIAGDKSVPTDIYTFFQKTQQAAFDFAVDPALNSGHLSLANDYVEGWTGSAVNNVFSVGFGNVTGGGTQALSINAAINAAPAGATIDVNSGTYAQDVSSATQLAFDFGTVSVNSLTLASGASGSSLNGNLTATGAIVSNGAVSLNGDFNAASIVLNGANTLAGDTTLDATGSVTTGTVDGAHALTVTAGTGASLGALGTTTQLGAVQVNGSATLTGNSYDAASLDLNGATTLVANTTLDATGSITTGTVDGAHALTVTSGTGASLGALGATTQLGLVQVNGSATLTGGTYDAVSIDLNGATRLAADTTLNATGSVTTGTVDGAHALTVTSSGASLGTMGSLVRVGAVQVNGPATLTGFGITAASIDLNGATTLAANNTLAGLGSVTTGSITGDHSLNVISDTDTISLGSLTGLGAVDIFEAATLTGNTYDAASLNFEGAVTLTADTSLDATGSVTTGTIDGAHALTVTSSGASLGALGATTQLGAVQVNGSATLTGGTYNAASIVLNGATTLAADTTLSATGSVTTGTVDGAHALTVTSTGASLGALGTTTQLGAVQVNGSATLTGGTYDAASIDLNGPITLAADTTLDATGSVTTGTVDGAHALTVTSSGASLGALGTTTRLGAVQVNGAATLTGGTYDASGIDLNGATTLAAHATLDATGSVTTGTVDGAHALTVTSSGASLGTIGSLTQVGAVQINGPATLTGFGITAASIDLNGATTLAANTTLLGIGSVTTGSITGDHSLDVIADTGTTSLGSLTGLGAVDIFETATLTGNTYDAASLKFENAVTLTADTILDATGSITTGTVDGAHALTVTSTGASLGALGATTQLGAVQVNGPATLTGGSYDAASIALNGATTLAADTILDATGSVTTGSIDGDHALSVTSGTGASLGALGATTQLGAVQVNNAATLTGGTYDAASLDFGGALTLAADTTLDATGSVTTGTVDGAHALTVTSSGASLGTMGSLGQVGAVQVNGPVTLTGFGINAASIDLNGATTLAVDTILNAAGSVTTGTVDGAHALTVTSTGASLGALGATTQLGAVQVNGSATLTGGTYDAASIALNGATTLAADTTLNARGSVTIGTVDGAHALTVTSSGTSLGALGAATQLGAVQVNGSATLTGGTYDATSIDLNGATTLAADTTLDATGSITTGTVDGAHALTVTSSGASLGALGTTARLGAVQVNGPATLTGGTYDAASLDFGGATTLTLATTVLNTTQSATAAGDITVGGALLGTSNGGQSLILTAGPGTGAASANGDITLQNVGSSTVALNNLTVTGDNFNAQTVDIAGNFTSTLVGDQVFSSHTLNAGGTVTGNVGGDASGPINGGSTVSLNVTGDVTGAIKGTTLDVTAGTVTDATLTGTQSVDLTANTVTGSTLTAPTVTATAGTFDSTVAASGTGTISGGTISGDFTGGTITLTGTNSVDATVTATNLDVQSPLGTVTGDWTTLDTTGSGTLVVNQEASQGNGQAGPNQLVVENFVLPAGTIINANGEIVLPAGLVIGLLSPGGAGGAPKLIYVQSVQSLGALLAEGYTAIVIDLSGHKKEKKDKKTKQQLALN